MLFKVRRAFGTAAIGLLATCGALALTTSTADADILGCPPGYACIITGDPPISGGVDYSWYYYGTYNIHNEYGNKAVCNQQTGWAVLRLYSGYDGTGTVLHTLKPADVGGHLNACHTIDLTPVNSVRLSAN